MMNTCRWCTPVTLGTKELLQKYASGQLTADDKSAINADLCFCLDCVVAYHKARDKLPLLHGRLWELEVSRLSACFSNASQEEVIEDDLFIVECDQTIHVPKSAEAESEKYLRLVRFPITEILKYPYLLAHHQLCEMFVEALCKLETTNPFQVFEKFPGIYLLLVYPNEQVRRWAIRAAKSLGKVDRDDFYDLQDTFSTMFCVLDLGVFHNADIYTSFTPENGKNVLLPSHLYDSKNHKDYWLGICMLLTQLDAQAMDSLLLAPAKQTEIIQCILKTMENSVEGEVEDPFWPSLQCFMVILDRLGSKIWGQLIEPTPAFQTITGSPSYTAEIDKIRQKSLMSKVKVEVNDDDMTCSQIIYDCNIKEKKKVNSIRRLACGESGSLIYEEMHSLVNVLQLDLGQDMRVHDSTFLWFIPFVQSVMDLNDLSVVYIGEVIHYLYGEIKDLISGRVQICDKATEFFTFILVFIIELHLSKSRMNVLYYSSPKWVEVIVKCATLPSTTFSHSLDSGSSTYALSHSSPVKFVVPQACMQIIRSLLREGGKLSSHTRAMHFLDLLNKQFREAPQKEWKLADTEVMELQSCLKQLVKMMKDKHVVPPADHIGHVDSEMPSVSSSNGCSGFTEDLKSPVKMEPMWEKDQYGSVDSSIKFDNVNVKTIQKDVLLARKEISHGNNHTEGSAELSLLPWSTKLSDPAKVQVIKSKLGPSLCSKLNVIKEKYNSQNAKDTSDHQKVLDRLSEEHQDIVAQEHLENSGSTTSNAMFSRGDKHDHSHLKSDDASYSDRLPLSHDKLLLKKRQKLKHTTESVDAVDKDIIVIPDSESESSDVSLDSNKEIENQSGKENNFNEPTDVKDAGRSPSWLYGGGSNEYDSQLFEFETQDYIYSEWTDCNVHSSGSAQETKNELTVSKAPLSPGLMGPSSTWEYDTDPISDETIENAMLQADYQILEEKESIGMAKVFLSPKDLPVKISGKGSPTRQKTRTVPINKERDRKNDASTYPSSSFAIGTPAIVPPKKPRKPIEPVSCAEKLGLKKRERKALDLSQRSLDCVGKLRRYGQEVGVDPVQCTRRRRKAKINSNRLNSRRPKKFLASQDLQFFRQSRAKPLSLQGASAVDNATENRFPEQTKTASSKWKHNFKSNAEKNDSFRLLSHVSPLTDYKEGEKKVDQRPQERAPKLNVSELNSTENKPSTSTVLHDCKHTEKFSLLNCTIEHKGGDDVTSSTCEDKSSSVGVAPEDPDLDPICLTQMDPLDMELCSQIEEQDENIFLTQRDPVDMDIDSDSQTYAEPSLLSDQQGDRVVLADSPQGEHFASKTSTCKTDDNHVFLKPGLATSFLKKAKPSTTKIYAASSRSATLVEEMEKSSKPLQSVIKNKVVRPLMPACKTRIPQFEFKQPLSPKPPVPFKPPPILSSVTGSLPHTPTYKTYPRPESPIVKSIPCGKSSYKCDQTFLIKAILKWTYDMFRNYTQFGLPSDLCQFQIKEVSYNYRSYDEYFGTFYPLLLINTFEELVSEWIKNTDSRTMSQNLKVNAIEYNSQICNASFIASLSEHDEFHQQYPKEEDLVILWLPQNTRSYSYDEPHLSEPHAHFGCVSRSNVMTGDERKTLNLTIQTYGKVSLINNQPVKCELVGSLVNAIRQFKALCLLKSNDMLRPLLGPQVHFFQAQQDRIGNLNLPEYNTEQAKAISSGISMVRRQEKTPKICLIYGPPGTGKSKTIVGLLRKLFSEDLESISAVGNRHSKTHKPRVLLCASSNAAIDSLMKKVIVEFKDICRDIQKPLGNCGDINVVRVGIEKTISESLKPFSLDSQTRNRTQKTQQPTHVDILRHKERLDQHIDNLSRELALVKRDFEKFKKLTDQKCKLLTEREQMGRHLREARSRRQETQAKVLQNAHVICSTLSTSGSMVLESAFRRLGHEPFSCVIVDEASQATELETLIPLMFRCPVLILVGDPEQLPPMVVSQTAKEKKYDQSLMTRLWKCLRRTVRENPQMNNPIIFLSRQYRMHPDICEFPSNYIYNRALKTDPDIAQKRCAINWPFQPYRLFDVTDGSESKDGESFCNLKEVNLVLIIIKLILEKRISRIGVITPYNAQKKRIQHLLSQEMSRSDNKNPHVEVDTVDGFQGREMDCIIVSCVRASSELGSIGFLNNRQRLNVTITRAKCSLFILGHMRTLREQKDWGALISDAGKRGTIIETWEENFKTKALQIFKPEKPVLPSTVRCPEEKACMPSTSAGHRPSPVIAHRASCPLPASSAKRPRMSPPSVAPRSSGWSRDPRLAARTKEPTPPLPPLSMSERRGQVSQNMRKWSRSSSFSGSRGAVDARNNHGVSHHPPPDRAHRDSVHSNAGR